MTDVYLLLGSNLGERITILKNAIRFINSRCGNVLKHSSVYETEAWGYKQQNSFLNMALLLKTDLVPHQLLSEIKAIEKDLGRSETSKWGPRLIDIDILMYGNKITESDDLKIPHPFMSERKFTLLPLSEIAGSIIHPKHKITINKLLQTCGDTSEVIFFSHTP